MINSKQQIIDLIKNNRSQLRKYGIVQVGLFGSFVRNQQDDKSDIDLLVDFDKRQKNYRNFISTANLFENLLGKNIDIVTPQSLSPYIRPYIEKEIEYVQIT